jgi:predicted DNA-binding protein (UPF0251 family)
LENNRDNQDNDNDNRPFFNRSRDPDRGYNGRPYDGRGMGRGMGRGRGRGRPPVARSMDFDRNLFAVKGIIELSSFELQILKMSDIEQLTQEEIAQKLKITQKIDISQTSVWRYLKAIREKLAKAVLSYEFIEIHIED